MENHYYINNNRQPEYLGGNFEIHKETCHYYYDYKDDGNFTYIGYCTTEQQALNESKNLFPTISDKIDGCAHCCPSIHKG